MRWTWPWQRQRQDRQGRQPLPGEGSDPEGDRRRGVPTEPRVPPVEMESDQAMRVYIRCQACGEPIALRVRLTDEVGRADEGSPFAYFVQKTVIGSGRRAPGSRRPPCFRPIAMRLELDRQYRVIAGTLAGGDWLTRNEYEQMHRQYFDHLGERAQE